MYITLKAQGLGGKGCKALSQLKKMTAISCDYFRRLIPSAFFTAPMLYYIHHLYHKASSLEARPRGNERSLPKVLRT